MARKPPTTKQLQKAVDASYAATVPKIAQGAMKFKVGDLVEVDEPGLAMLRNLCPGLPPNHHGQVEEVLDGDRYMILFDDTKQCAPYPGRQLRLRK